MRSAVLPVALVALGVLACEPTGWLRGVGAHVIREVSAPEGMRLIAAPEVVLVQVRSAGDTAGRVAGTEILGTLDPVPERIARGAAVVILAESTEEGLRAAARLVRAGIEDVSVVRGGVSAWEAATRAPPAGGPRERT